MHDAYDPAPGTARCPHCADRVAVPRFIPTPAVVRAWLDLVCPLGHVWHEVRTATSRDRYWQSQDDDAPASGYPDPTSAVRLPASPRVPRAASTPA